MADFYSTLTRNPLGKTVTGSLGLPQPVVLRRGRVLPERPLALGSLPGSDLGALTLALLGLEPLAALLDTPQARTTDDEGRAQPPAYAERLGGIVLDATAARTIADLETVRGLLRPALRSMGSSGRVVVLGTHPDAVEGVEATAVAQALDGITRSVGKEMRAGGHRQPGAGRRHLGAGARLDAALPARGPLRLRVRPAAEARGRR